MKPTSPRPPRILLHSHDSYGLGHLRRTLSLSQALVETLPGASVLIVTGSPCATHFELPRGVDVIKLPSATKDRHGDLTPRRLAEGFSTLLRLRERILLEVFEAFAPDLLLVDHQPLGLGGELREVLLRARELGCRTVLGLRDIIDEPSVVAREWSRPEIREALVEFYDRACVYGCPSVFDMRLEYPVPPELRERVEFVGYVVRPGMEAPRPRPTQIERRVLVTMGGGEDGSEHVFDYLDALALGPCDWKSTIVLGPLMPAESIRRIKRRTLESKDVEVRRFHADLPRLLSQSSAVVSMAGYNTVSEILASRTPAVLLPRVFPRKEQYLRALRLQHLGLATTFTHPTPERLRRAVQESLECPPDWSCAPRMDGAQTMAELVGSLLGIAPSRWASEARVRAE